MNNRQELDTLKDIKKMMERSSRFISLSGWSGVVAGICGLIGSWFLYEILKEPDVFLDRSALRWKLLIVGSIIFFSALILAFIFTYIRSNKVKAPIWSPSSRRLLVNVGIPFIAGGFFIIKIMLLGYFELVVPACLIVYGVSIFCGSKQTVSEIKYLGCSEMFLGVICLFYLEYGLAFWALGFGVLHILYGIIMWVKYEKGVKYE